MHKILEQLLTQPQALHLNLLEPHGVWGLGFRSLGFRAPYLNTKTSQDLIQTQNP